MATRSAFHTHERVTYTGLTASRVEELGEEEEEGRAASHGGARSLEIVGASLGDRGGPSMERSQKHRTLLKHGSKEGAARPRNGASVRKVVPVDALGRPLSPLKDGSPLHSLAGTKVTKPSTPSPARRTLLPVESTEGPVCVCVCVRGPLLPCGDAAGAPVWMRGCTHYCSFARVCVCVWEAERRGRVCCLHLPRTQHIPLFRSACSLRVPYGQCVRVRQWCVCLESVCA